MKANDLMPLFGSALSIIAAFMPGVSAWYDSLESDKKQLAMLGGLAIVAIGAALGSYFGLIHMYDISKSDWYVQVLYDFVMAVVASAGTYKATNKIKDSQTAKKSKTTKPKKVEEEGVG